MKVQQAYREFSRLCEYGKSLSLLLVRFVLAYGFYQPAMVKWQDVPSVAQWFGSLGIPFPFLGAYLASIAEISGVILLALGFLTRLISLPLIIVMIVAIISVHLENGFSAGNNGFEIPLYYLVMLFVLLVHGAGKFSIDQIFFGKKS